MRLTKEQIAQIRKDAPDELLDMIVLPHILALCDMADELLDADGDSNIRDLRDICETLAKRISSLEGKPQERDCERRRYWVADRRTAK